MPTDIHISVHVASVSGFAEYRVQSQQGTLAKSELQNEQKHAKRATPGPLGAHAGQHLLLQQAAGALPHVSQQWKYSVQLQSVQGSRLPRAHSAHQLHTTSQHTVNNSLAGQHEQPVGVGHRFLPEDGDSIGPQRGRQLPRLLLDGQQALPGVGGQRLGDNCVGPVEIGRAHV